MIVADGEIVGTWTTPKVRDKRGALPALRLFRPDSVSEQELTAAATRYAAFAAT